MNFHRVVYIRYASSMAMAIKCGNNSIIKLIKLVALIEGYTSHYYFLYSRFIFCITSFQFAKLSNRNSVLFTIEFIY